MLLSEMLESTTIVTGIKLTDKLRIIGYLIDVLSQNYKLSDKIKLDIRKKIFAREKSMSTGFGKGIAVPHADVDGIKSAMAVLGVLSKPINYNAIDGKPVKIIILLTMPSGHFKEHILTLSGIAHLMDNSLLRHKILTLKKPEKIFSVILSEEINKLLKN